jgi:hypothetical protein
MPSSDEPLTHCPLQMLERVKCCVATQKRKALLFEGLNFDCLFISVSKRKEQEERLTQTRIRCGTIAGRARYDHAVGG